MPSDHQVSLQPSQQPLQADPGDSDRLDDSDDNSEAGEMVDVDGEEMYIIDYIVKAKGSGRSRK